MTIAMMMAMITTSINILRLQSVTHDDVIMMVKRIPMMTHVMMTIRMGVGIGDGDGNCDDDGADGDASEMHGYNDGADRGSDDDDAPIRSA